MGSRLKEDEKNEKNIRGLLKQPGNRKCVNCNMLGPQYVCTTFSTFVCTTCSGIHREFTHRVKSVSMAKFTLQEITSLQAGGNECAREIYFKEWDPQRNYPDNSNVDRLRDFIKQVYVHKRYSGGRSIDRSPQAVKEELNESKRSDGYHSGSQSPSYDDTYQRRYSDRASPGYDVRSSPGYDQDTRRYSDFGRSSVCSGVVNDWRREDRFLNGRKSEDCPSSDGDSRSEVRSPDSQKGSDMSSPPMVRPVRDILGENVVPLQISEPPKTNTSTISDGSTLTQRTPSTSSLESSNVNPTEVKRETSLIDFDAEPEPPVKAIEFEAQAQQSNDSQSVGQSTNKPSDDNWACFDNIPKDKVSVEPPSSNSLESLLTQSSLPASVSFAGSTSSSVTQSLVSGDDLLLASLGDALAATSKDVISNAIAQQPQAVQDPTAQTTEVKFTRRKELPEDLFAATYFPVPYQAPGWHTGVAPGIGYQMPYNTAMSMPTFPQPSKSSNPFEVNAEASPAQATTFPSMSSLHTTLPNMESSRAVVDIFTPAWAPQSLSYPSTGPPFVNSFGLAAPGTYMVQQFPSNMASSRPQGFGIVGSELGTFGSLNSTANATPNPAISGNPFG